MWYYDSSKTEKENMEECVLAFPDFSVTVISVIFLAAKETSAQENYNVLFWIKKNIPANDLYR